MRIGIVGAISLDLLSWPTAAPDDLPDTASASAAVSALANALLARGHDVHVFTLTPRLQRPIHYRAGALAVSVAPQRERHRGKDAYAAERHFLSTMIAASQCDVLHAQWSYEYALAALSSSRPTLVTVRDHAAAIARFSPGAHRALKLIMDLVTKHRAPCLTVTSPYLMRTLPPAVRRKALLIPNFVSSEVLFRGLGTHAVDVTPVVVSVTNGFSRWKNIAVALTANRLLRTVRPDCRLRLVGADMQVNGPVHQFARRRGLESGVEFLGPVPHPQVMDHLLAADVMLHPAREEAFGMAVLEAMAAGAPVVGGSSSGNVPRLLEDGCGVLCDVERDVDVAASVAALLEEPTAARLVALRARRRVEAMYCEDAVLPNYVAAYENLLDARCDDS